VPARAWKERGRRKTKRNEGWPIVGYSYKQATPSGVSRRQMFSREGSGKDEQLAAAFER